MLSNAVTYLDIIKNVNDFDSAKKQIGELITSLIPLNNPGVHLLDGGLVENTGIYSEFIDYVDKWYTNSSKALNIIQYGNLTNNNGVLSGFNGSKYAKLPLSFNPGSKGWEIVVKITSPQNQTKFNDFLGIFLKLAIGINTAGKFNLAINYTTTWEAAIGGSHVVVPNTEYWIKVVFTGTQYILSYSTDGSNYTTDITINSTTKVSGPITLGKYITSSTADSTASLEGTMDLKACYINIDNKRWWNGNERIGFATELEWQDYVSVYNNCGKFVYDAENHTVRLPKIKGFIQGTSDVDKLGFLKEAGLPNITGSIKCPDNFTVPLTNNTTFTDSGSIYTIAGVTSQAYSTTSNSAGRLVGIGLDASRSSSVYGKSNTVQPQSIEVLYYIVLVNGSTETIDYNINNLTTKHSACNVVMPDSDTYDNLVMGASGTKYTAPADGYYWFNIVTSRSTDYFNAWSKGNELGYGITLHQTNNGYNQMGLIPIKKGETLQLIYDKAPTSYTFRFYYCVGNKDEKGN